MNTNNSNVPIYPIPHPSSEYDYFGLTKREYFAAMAMQGILAASNTSDGGFYTPDEKNVAQRAREYADALIAELNK